MAIHGGGYTSKYFDVPGASAMELVAGLGYDVLAVDRPGYAANQDWLLGFDDQVKVLATATSWARNRFGTPEGQVFLYGHSIGGMLSLLMANAAPAQYLGVSMTGSGAVYHDRAVKGLTARMADPKTGSHSMSGEAARRAVFMAPPWSYDVEVTKLDPERDVPSMVADLRDALQWSERLRSEGPRARVPVQFVVPEYDGLWRSDAAATQGVRELFSQAPFADVYVQRHAGHSVELHHLWRAHVEKVVAFCEECRVERRRTA
jgi:pimeloyl-ACP methyl ester carboxylesterase